MAEEVGRSEAVRPLGGESWHLADPVLPVTLCGETILYGSRRRRYWHEAPKENRCEMCFRGFIFEPPG